MSMSGILFLLHFRPQDFFCHARLPVHPAGVDTGALA